MFGWRDFGRKREGKKIGRKWITFPCLDEGKNGEGNFKQCKIVNGSYMNNKKFFSPQPGEKVDGGRGHLSFPTLLLFHFHKWERERERERA